MPTHPARKQQAHPSTVSVYTYLEGNLSQSKPSGLHQLDSPKPGQKAHLPSVLKHETSLSRRMHGLYATFVKNSDLKTHVSDVEQNGLLQDVVPLPFLGVLAARFFRREQQILALL